MENFSLTYTRMVVTCSSYPESSGVINCLLRRYQIQIKKSSAQIRRPIEHSFRKELQQNNQTDICPPYQILDRIDKENDGIFEESSTEVNIKQTYNYRLSNDSNSRDPYTEILPSAMEQK